MFDDLYITCPRYLFTVIIHHEDAVIRLIHWKQKDKNLLKKHQYLHQKLVIILKRLCLKDEKLIHEIAEGMFTYHLVSIFLFIESD